MRADLGGAAQITAGYCIQMDGSRNLDTVLPVEQTTWGRIKARYSKTSRPAYA